MTLFYDYTKSISIVFITINSWICIGYFFENTKYGGFYRVWKGMFYMFSKLIFIFLLFFSGISIFSSLQFYYSPYFKDFNSAFRSQFALLFNDNLLLIYTSIIKNKLNTWDNVSVVLFMFVNWVFFVGIMTKIIVSIVNTTYHYTKLIGTSNEESKELTIDNHIRNEILKLTADIENPKEDEEENEEEKEERKINLLVSLNHLALLNTNDYNKNKDDKDQRKFSDYVSNLMTKDYIREMEDYNSKKILSELLLDESEYVKIYRNTCERLFNSFDFYFSDITKQLLNEENMEYLHTNEFEGVVVDFLLRIRIKCFEIINKK